MASRITLESASYPLKNVSHKVGIIAQEVLN
jgi:hypothetical protein